MEGLLYAIAALVIACTGLLKMIVRLKRENKVSGKVNNVLMGTLKKTAATMDLEASLEIEDSMSIAAADEGVGDVIAMLAQAHDDGSI